MTKSEADRTEALDDLAGELYQALRGIARRALYKGARLDPTDLVHQAWIRLARNEVYHNLTRTAFLAFCATIMRRIAVDEGRRRVRERRDPDRITLSGIQADGDGQEVDLLALDEALVQLEKVDARWARIVELRFFAGLTGEQVAEAMDLSTRSVAREWTLARAWLRRKLGAGD